MSIGALITTTFASNFGADITSFGNALNSPNCLFGAVNILVSFSTADNIGTMVSFVLTGQYATAIQHTGHINQFS
jgi:hypothetical protein